MNRSPAIWPIIFCAALFITQGCAIKPDRSDEVAFAIYEETNDPLEPMNRYFFELTRFADFIFLQPFSEIYKNIVPKRPRIMLNNFYSNLNEPVNLINNILQGNLERSGITAARILINTTIGFGGFFDPADYFGFQEKPEDLGQTLAVYGMPEGPFLFLPFAGPSSFRGVIGTTAGLFINPIRYVNLQDIDILLNVRFPVRAIEASASSRQFVEQVERQSIDYYATIRELYRQNRRNAILNGELDFDTLPDLPEDDFFEEDKRR